LKFELLDKVTHLDATRIVALKNVALAEEYLADHFPTFPVLPGVMMLEALVQASGWLLHHRRDFARSVVVLKDARNFRYGQFVAPGSTLVIESEFVKDTDAGASFKVVGKVDQEQALSGRLELAYFNLAEKNADLASLDERLMQHTRERWTVLRPSTIEASSHTITI
jgi:3-hydroxyacyl-[acyl-carrier-protein] dehydratase